MERLRDISLDAYDRLVGLELGDVAVEGCITKAPCGGEKAGKSPVDRGKGGIKRSTAVDASGIPLGTVTAPAKAATTRRCFGRDPRRGGRDPRRAAGSGEHPPRPRLRLGYHPRASARGAQTTGGDLAEGQAGPAKRGREARWVIERTNSWHNAHKKLLWCTERRGRIIDFWVAFSDVVIIVRRLIREGWRRYRWEGRPSRCP
jgi:hypothetical protein